MLLAIPSKSRPYQSKSKNLLSSAKLFIPEAEYKDYRNHFDAKDLIGVPDSVKGITRTRNWILKNCNEREVVFVDDDLKRCGYWISKPNEKGRKFINVTSESIITGECEKLFEICEGIGYKIWGLKTEGSKISQYDEKPFLFLTYVTASFMGIINDGEFYFDELFDLKEDYEIALRHIVNKGGILGARYLTWENEHWGKNGGCGDYRTGEKELKCINMLIEKYPQFVHKVKRKGNSYSIRLFF